MVPYEGQRALYDKLRTEALAAGLTKSLLRMAAPLTIACYDRELVQKVCEPLFLAGKGCPEARESPYYILLSGQEDCYDRKMGFYPPETQGFQNVFW